MITIDGSRGEGGGQILRTSLALSLITGQAFRMVHVRARRSKPGLQPQHLMSVKAAAAISGATVHGAELRSQDLIFEPGPVKPGDYRFAIGTAGATGLILHTIYLPLALAGGESRVTIEGGTHVPHSPCYHFLETTWRGYMKQLGLSIDLAMDRPGFYPRGRITAGIHGCSQEKLKPIRIEDLAAPRVVTGFSAVAGLPESIAERQERRVRERLEEAGCEVHLDRQRWGGGPGTVIGLTVPTIPVPTFFFALGARGKRAEAVADEAAGQVLDFLGSQPPGIDEHSADQILLPLALPAGQSVFPVARITDHLFTNRETIQTFLKWGCDIAGQIGEVAQVTTNSGK
ncbi:MAG: RNA 3'-terminal phosphate cyclase [Gemmataceae bacterium]